MPQRRDQRERRHRRQRARQHRPPLGGDRAKPQLGVGAGGMGVVVGMARRVQHPQRGDRIGGVPAVAGADGLVLPGRDLRALEAVVLHVICEQDLHLRVKAQREIGDHPGKAKEPPDEEHAPERAQDIADIGVHRGEPGAPALGRKALAPGLFHLPAGNEGAGPGLRREGPEAFAEHGAVRVVAGGDEAVVHQPVRRGVMAVKQRDIDPFAQHEEPLVGAVDELVRVRVRHLPEEQPAGEEERDAGRDRQTRHPGECRDAQKQQPEMRDRQRHRQPVGGGKLAALGRVRGGARDQPVKGVDQPADPGDGQPGPDPAEQRAEHDQWHRREGHCGEDIDPGHGAPDRAQPLRKSGKAGGKVGAV
ncbi:hypothetical protein SDC9_30407 [bioreactor metagenome]|uniref:Uncharacterized protein n=1 Tax=bioreactor metagenome TaxID=1076179 RepID=A0A644V0M0_9ZZZZ